MLDPDPHQLSDAHRQFVSEVLDRTEAVGAASFEERLARLEDRQRVGELIGRYAYLADLRHLPELFDLYADDVERTVAGTMDETVRGKDELRKVLESRAPTPGGSGSAAAAGGRRSDMDRRHHIDTEVIKISDDGTQAWAVAIGSVVVLTGSEQQAHEVVYLFSLRKDVAAGDVGSWKISRQVVVTEQGHNRLLHPVTAVVPTAAAEGACPPGASAVSDAMDQLGLASGVPRGIARVTGGDRIVVGPARVGVVSDTHEPGIPGLAEFLDGASPGDVLVVAWDAQAECSIFGDVGAARALRAGAAGVVVDGWCRDVDTVDATGLSVHARGTTPLSARGRLRLHPATGAVCVGGVTVANGDLVFADRTGVCVVPMAERDAVLELAAEIERRDGEVRQSLTPGASFPGGATPGATR